MGLPEYFQMLARYNRIANERLYGRCAGLSDAEYRGERRGSFGSIHALLNHILVGDRIWMARFEGQGSATPLALNTILYDSFAELRDARAEFDGRIEAFFSRIDDAALAREMHYVNNAGVAYVDAFAMVLAHFFNHQTHHRGQVHVMLSQTEVRPPSLDLHRIIHP